MESGNGCKQDIQLENKRKIKKKFRNIRKQMEFYFSDSNIAKDKFLLELINKNTDGFVDLEVFKTFNKIKAITQNTEDICNALSKSEALQMSSDNKQVRRISPLPDCKNFDACTVYVEKLPSHADQKWLRDIFERFGDVAHVNLPHFKNSGKIKGYAFVEFTAPESVEKACQCFGRDKNDESDEDTKCKKLGRKKKFEHTTQDKNPQETKCSKSDQKSISESNSESEQKTSSVKSEDNKTEPINEDKNDAELSKKSHKRKRTHGSESSEEMPKKTKQDIKKETDTEVTVSLTGDSKGAANDHVQKEEKLLVSTGDSKEAANDHVKKEEKLLKKSGEDVALRSEKRRKRHSKGKSDSLRLRVITKAEWKAYRNKFLTLQRATLSHLKRTIVMEAQRLQESEADAGESESASKHLQLQFVANVIVKVTLKDPIVSSTAIKSQVKSHAVQVAYIDAPVGHTIAHIRCNNSQDAKTIVDDGKLNHLGLLEILRDAEETQYWEKLENDRKIKFSSTVNHKKRGRDKIIAKATKINEQKNKHMYFDE